jgi:hypothetical protein
VTDRDRSKNIFARTFAEHYPFATLGKPDWVAMPAADARVGLELYTEMRDLLAGLHDPHVALVAPNLDEMFFGAEQGGRDLTEEDRAAALALVGDKYLSASGRTLAGGRLLFGWLTPELAYLRVPGFYGYGAEDGGADDAEAMHGALDELLDEAAGAQALVLDMRDNDGGSDSLAIELARRFTDRAYVAYRKQAVAEISADRQVIWASQDETMVEPIEGRPAYTGEVILLTSADTVSAGETFVMAMMGRATNTRRLGSPTRGSFSDMLPRMLPNGWLFALPNERYVDAAGDSYDGTGIPPHLAVPDVTAADIRASIDRALETILTLGSGAEAD